MHSMVCARDGNTMPATVVLGAQWGDEGKGKLVDRLAENATWVARFQGGNNAGHTVVLGDRVLKFHLLPSGITREECGLVLGDGMVIDPWVLDRELSDWVEGGGKIPLATDYSYLIALTLSFLITPISMA